MRKIFYHFFTFLSSVFIFILAMGLMKEGARPLAPFFRNAVSVDSPSSALGFGWLAASLMLSGSPVAATALSLMDAQVLNAFESFAMISGSRLGAAFIVLLIGFIYMLRGKQRDISIGVGMTSLLVTQTIYPAVLAIGFFLLKVVDPNINSFRGGANVHSVIDLVMDPVLSFLNARLPVWVLFPAGFLLILGSLWLFDRAIPELRLQKTSLGGLNHLLYRPAVTFLLGLVVTAITMSVSVSLSLLVPLSMRGFVRRENVIPYIMGANITTFIDTLAAAVLLNNLMAVQVVFVQMISVALVSLLILLLGYRFYVSMIERIVVYIGKSRWMLAVYIFLILGVPFFLLIFT